MTDPAEPGSPRASQQQQHQTLGSPRAHPGSLRASQQQQHQTLGSPRAHPGSPRASQQQQHQILGSPRAHQQQYPQQQGSSKLQELVELLSAALQQLRKKSPIHSSFVDQLTPPQQETVSEQIIKTASLISSPKQLVFEGSINKVPVTFLLDGGANHSILSQQFAVRNGIIIRPLDQEITAKFANGTSGTIKFATDPLHLQCQGHRSRIQPLVSDNVSIDLLLGLDWLSTYNPRVYWDTGSLCLSDSDCAYIWNAKHREPDHHVSSLSVRLCVPGRVRADPTENENSANRNSNITQATEAKAPPQLTPGVQTHVQQFSGLKRTLSSQPPNRMHQHKVPSIAVHATFVAESPSGSKCKRPFCSIGTISEQHHFDGLRFPDDSCSMFLKSKLKHQGLDEDWLFLVYAMTRWKADRFLHRLPLVELYNFPASTPCPVSKRIQAYHFCLDVPCFQGCEKCPGCPSG